MNYCKSLKLGTKDGSHWFIEYEGKTVTNIYSMDSYESGVNIMTGLVHGVDEWVLTDENKL